MLLLYLLTIFIGNSRIIVSGDKLTALRLNGPNQGDFTVCSTDVEEVQFLNDGSSVELNDVVTEATTIEPMRRLSAIIENFFYGRTIDIDDEQESKYESEAVHTSLHQQSKPDIVQYPTGRVMHSELFRNKSGVHLPAPDLLHTEHCRLRVTNDYMQTAVDAFAIIFDGSLSDVLSLPAEYVLHSARTISLMTLPLEKFSAMWTVVLGRRRPNTITRKTLELYRPLFKYLTGKQIARLNLSDPRIINYIGTHPELNRHQMGVVASKYIQVNPDWKKVQSLSNMNNLLCGVPMSFMRRISSTEYLRLEHQVFFHVRACDPLQKRFYLNMMTKTQALGKSFSWSAREVSRLGLLLAEVDGPALALISPEAMTGITPHVMAEIKPENLKYITNLQLRYICPKSKNILSKKLKNYEKRIADTACRFVTSMSLGLALFALQFIRILVKNK